MEAASRHVDDDNRELSLKISELHKQLQKWSSSSDWSATDSAAADAQLQQLRHLSAGIQRSGQHLPSMIETAGGSELQEIATAVSCVELLTDMLLQPPQALYSGLSGVPSQPGPGLELAGEQHQLVLAAQLQLLSQLVLLFKELETPPAVEQSCSVDAPSTRQGTTSRNRPTYFEGIVVIEELPSEDTHNSSSSSLTQQLQQQQRQLQQMTIQLLLVAALYATDHSSSNMCSSARMALTSCIAATGTQATAAVPVCGHTLGDTSSTHSNCPDLSSFCDTILQQSLQLSTPWSGPSAQQQAGQLAHQLISSIRVDSQSSSADKTCLSKHPAPNSSSNSGMGGSRHRPQNGDAAGAAGQQELLRRSHPSQQQQQQQYEEEQQQVWCRVLPLLLDKLRDTLLAQHRHKKLQDKGDFVTYSGPSTFHRCLASRQLSWLVQQLQPQTLAEPQTLGVLLPLVLAVSDDPSPCVQQYGHAALGWLGLQAAAGAGAGAGGSGLQWQSALLCEEARRLVVGCEETCWETALPAATCLTMALEGKDQRSSAYHSLILELLQEAERGAHKPKPRLVFMACMSLLAPRLGLYMVRHLASLMPLLLEWVHAYDEDSSVVAMQLLQQLVVFGWPRMSVHADVIRQHLREVVQQECVERGSRAAGQLQGLQEGSRHACAKGDAAVAGNVRSRRYQCAKELLQLLSCL